MEAEYSYYLCSRRFTIHIFKPECKLMDDLTVEIIISIVIFKDLQKPMRLALP